jgi:VWFA-related protein
MRENMFFGAAILVAIVTFVASLPAGAQVMSGDKGRVPPIRGVPTLDLDTDVGSNRPMFEVEVTRVVVSVRVTVGDGVPMRGLRASDFQLFEDGTPQTITSFLPYSFNPVLQDVTAPVAGDEADRLADPSTNVWMSSSRLFAIVIDDLHVDPRNTARVRRLARHFVEQLDPSDLLLVALTSAQLTTETFSRDRRRALALIDNAAGQRLPDPTLELVRTPGVATQGGATPGLRASQQQRAMQLEQAYDTVGQVAASVMHLPGRRKTLFFISEGSPVGALSGHGGSGAHNALHTAVAAASIADVAIYSISPAGLDTPGERLIEGFVRAQDETGRPIAHEDLTNVLAQHQQAKVQLRELARLTGGVSLVDTNDFEGAVERVIGDASHHYLLSYEPDDPIVGATLRSIEVKVTHPDVRVEVRPGYMAPGTLRDVAVRTPSGLSRDLQRLLSDTVPSDGLGLRVQAVPLVERRNRTLMAVVVEVDGPSLTVGMDGQSVDMEQAVFTLDDRGRVSNTSRRRLSIDAGADQMAVLRDTALRTVFAIELPPGDHQVRLGVLDEVTRRGGSLYLDVRVEKAQPPRGIAVASHALSMVPTAFVDRTVSRLLDHVPTATRIFPPDDTLQVTVSGLQGTTGLLRLHRQDGGDDVVHWETHLEGDRNGLARAAVPLAGLPAGTHRLIATTSEGPAQILPIAVGAGLSPAR